MLVALLFTLATIVIVTVSSVFSVSIVTTTVRVELFVVAVPFVVVALLISRYEERVSFTLTFVTGAVPLLATLIVKLKLFPMRASLGLTDLVMDILGVPVLVSVSEALLLLVFASGLVVEAMIELVNEVTALGSPDETVVLILKTFPSLGPKPLLRVQT